MKIYLIHSEIIDDRYLDRHNAFVIAANTEQEVIDLAISWSEKFQHWFGTNITVVGEYTGDATAPFVVLDDYHAA